MATPPTAPPLSSLRRAVKRALFASGYYTRRLAQLDFPGAAVLCYHGLRSDGEAPLPFNELHVCERTFEKHCAFIAANCHPISLADLRAARSGARPLPRRAVLVTFDDGYRAVLDVALPILERYRMPAVVFSCSGPIADGAHFWFDSVCRTAGEGAVLEARSAPAERWNAFVAANVMPASVAERHRPLTLDELKQLTASPLIEIGGHTLSHPTLALMSVAQQQYEIDGCRAALEQMIGRPIDAFAYPYGLPRLHYSADTVSVVQRAGFAEAFTTGQSFARTDCDAYEIPRFVMLDSIDEVELAHRLSHSWHP